MWWSYPSVVISFKLHLFDDRWWLSWILNRPPLQFVISELFCRYAMYAAQLHIPSRRGPYSDGYVRSSIWTFSSSVTSTGPIFYIPSIETLPVCKSLQLRRIFKSMDTYWSVYKQQHFIFIICWLSTLIYMQCVGLRLKLISLKFFFQNHISFFMVALSSLLVEVSLIIRYPIFFWGLKSSLGNSISKTPPHVSASPKFHFLLYWIVEALI